MCDSDDIYLHVFLYFYRHIPPCYANSWQNPGRDVCRLRDSLLLPLLAMEKYSRGGSALLRFKVDHHKDSIDDCRKFTINHMPIFEVTWSFLVFTLNIVFDYLVPPGHTMLVCQRLNLSFGRTYMVVFLILSIRCLMFNAFLTRFHL